jgi:uncharacterized Ntn-hydrolase superfamily protein
LGRLLSADPGGAGRQVGIVDAAGGAAAHTGSTCMSEAGHVVGDGVCCQANIMTSASVWPAMLQAFERTDGPLAGRLLAALDAAEAQGGDIRGRQSAALLVVPGDGEEWESKISLRVEDHPEPLVELRRLVALREAYELAGEADALVNESRHDEAAKLYMQASKRAPDNHELLFWAGLGAAQSGDMDAALARVRQAIAMQPGWEVLLGRLPADVAPAAQAVLARLSDNS